jgi:hypothetical protein
VRKRVGGNDRPIARTTQGSDDRGAIPSSEIVSKSLRSVNANALEGHDWPGLLSEGMFFKKIEKNFRISVVLLKKIRPLLDLNFARG